MKKVSNAVVYLVVGGMYVSAILLLSFILSTFTMAIAHAGSTVSTMCDENNNCKPVVVISNGSSGSIIVIPDTH